MEHFFWTKVVNCMLCKGKVIAIFLNNIRGICLQLFPWRGFWQADKVTEKNVTIDDQWLVSFLACWDIGLKWLSERLHPPCRFCSRMHRSNLMAQQVYVFGPLWGMWLHQQQAETRSRKVLSNANMLHDSTTAFYWWKKQRRGLQNRKSMLNRFEICKLHLQNTKWQNSPTQNGFLWTLQCFSRSARFLVTAGLRFKARPPSFLQTSPVILSFFTSQSAHFGAKEPNGL